MPSLLLAAEAGGQANTAEVVLFIVLGVIALGSGLAMVTMRNIVHSALMLVINFLAIAGLYLALQSSFLTVIQIVVYAGAIMVLFLFVIMLLGVDQDDLLIDVQRRHQIMAVLGVAALAGVLLFTIAGVYTSSESRCGDQAPAGVVASAETRPCVGMDDALAVSDSDSVGVVAERMFSRYTFPFEVAAVLLTVATIGAMVLGRRKDLPPDEDPAFEPSADVPDPADLAMALASLESLDIEAQQAGAPTSGLDLVADDPEVTAAQANLAAAIDATDEATGVDAGATGVDAGATGVDDDPTAESADDGEDA